MYLTFFKSVNINLLNYRFALFVLIPLILIFISMLLWNMSQGINMLDGFFDWAFNLIKAPLLALFSFSKSPVVKLQGQAIDVDFLIDRILASDKFSELAQHQPNQASSSGDYEKLVEFAKLKLQDVEKELKATNEALFDQMSKKIDFAESKVKDLKDSHSNIDYDQLRHELSEIKTNLEGQGSGGDQEILTLKSNVQQLMEKHDDLAKKREGLFIIKIVKLVYLISRVFLA